MALSTYLCAPFTARVVACRRWKLLPLALAAMWLCVDGLYSIYWLWRNSETLALMRSGNAPASSCLYLLCAMIWLHDGSLREVLTLRRRPFRQPEKM